MARAKSLAAARRVEQAIIELRNHRVLLDEDLALLYGTTTKRLNEQVRRNADRFPVDFAFVLTDQEVADLKSQNATSRSKWGGRRKPPRVFTEHGALMAASVLNTPIAVGASIEVVRAFVRMRQLMTAHADLARKVSTLEQKYDGQFRVVFDALRELMKPPEGPSKPRIGY
jgi:hypothetical protein